MVVNKDTLLMSLNIVLNLSIFLNCSLFLISCFLLNPPPPPPSLICPAPPFSFCCGFLSVPSFPNCRRFGKEGTERKPQQKLKGGAGQIREGGGGGGLRRKQLIKNRLQFKKMERLRTMFKDINKVSLFTTINYALHYIA